MPRPLGARRHRAFACYARTDAEGVVQRCAPADNKIIYDTREAAEQAAVAVALVDPTGDRLRAQPCWLRRGHFHLRTASKTRKAARARTGSGVTESGQKMAEKTTEARTYECDAPKCDVTHVCVGDQEPKGIRLTAEVADEKPVTAYACKPTHIRPAVEARLAAQAQPADVEPERGDDEDPRTDAERDTDAQFEAAKTQGMTSHADRVAGEHDPAEAEEDEFASAGAPV